MHVLSWCVIKDIPRGTITKNMGGTSQALDVRLKEDPPH